MVLRAGAKAGGGGGGGGRGGAGEKEGDICCVSCGLKDERDGKGWLVDVERGGNGERGKSLPFADWALSDCSSS